MWDDGVEDGSSARDMLPEWFVYLAFERRIRKRI